MSSNNLYVREISSYKIQWDNAECKLNSIRYYELMVEDLNTRSSGPQLLLIYGTLPLLTINEAASQLS